MPSPEISTNTRSTATGYWIGTMLPVMTIMPRRNGVPTAASLPASQTRAFSGWPITSPPLAVADCAPIDREARRHLSKVQHRPVGHRCTKNHPGIPYIAGHHSRGIEPLYNHTANPRSGLSLARIVLRVRMREARALYRPLLNIPLFDANTSTGMFFKSFPHPDFSCG